MARQHINMGRTPHYHSGNSIFTCHQVSANSQSVTMLRLLSHHGPDDFKLVACPLPARPFSRAFCANQSMVFPVRSSARLCSSWCPRWQRLLCDSDAENLPVKVTSASSSPAKQSTAGPGRSTSSCRRSPSRFLESSVLKHPAISQSLGRSLKRSVRLSFCPQENAESSL